MTEKYKVSVPDNIITSNPFICCRVQMILMIFLKGSDFFRELWLKGIIEAEDTGAYYLKTSKRIANYITITLK